MAFYNMLLDCMLTVIYYTTQWTGICVLFWVVTVHMLSQSGLIDKFTATFIAFHWSLTTKLKLKTIDLTFLAALSSSISYLVRWLVPWLVGPLVSRFVEIVTPAYLYWPLLTLG